LQLNLKSVNKNDVSDPLTIHYIYAARHFNLPQNISKCFSRRVSGPKPIGKDQCFLDLAGLGGHFLAERGRVATERGDGIGPQKGGLGVLLKCGCSRAFNSNVLDCITRRFSGLPWVYRNTSLDHYARVVAWASGLTGWSLRQLDPDCLDTKRTQVNRYSLVSSWLTLFGLRDISHHSGLVLSKSIHEETYLVILDSIDLNALILVASRARWSSLFHKLSTLLEKILSNIPCKSIFEKFLRILFSVLLLSSKSKCDRWND